MLELAQPGGYGIDEMMRKLKKYLKRNSKNNKSNCVKKRGKQQKRVRLEWMLMNERIREKEKILIPRV